jgi:glycosyltransferase involved in cell wall biosynthesis
VVEEGKTGHLVPSGDFQLMADRITTQAQDPELRNSFGAAGRRLVEERYNLKRVIEGIEDIYYRVLKIPQD